MVAPGHTIHSAFSDGIQYSHQCGGTLGEEDAAITTMSGTSMATPIVAGTAALARQYFVEGFLPHPPTIPASQLTLGPAAGPQANRGFQPSAALLRAVLINSAASMKGNVQVSLDAGSFALPSTEPNFYSGYGRILLANTLCLAQSNPECSLFVLEGPQLSPVVSLGPTGHSAQRHSVMCVTVPGGASTKVTVAWTDLPGNPAWPHALVNDLDLSVTNVVDGTTNLGNQGLYDSM